jgi:hypothetical protein
MRFRYFLSLAALALLTTATLASAQPTTVHVSPVASNPTASGTNLLNALASITTASAANPYVLKLDPGIYDVGTTIVQMKAYVDIEGSGQQSTIIRGPGNNDNGGLTAIVKGAAPAELRNLQVLSQGTAGQASSIAVFLGAAATSLRDVTLTSSGATVNWGLRNFSAGSPTLLNVGITVSGGTLAYGISNTGADGSSPVIKRAVVVVSGATSNYGIYNDGISAVKEVRDVEVTASGGTNNYGFYTAYGTTGLTVEIDNSNFFASANNAYGIYITSTPPTLILSQTSTSALHNFFLGGSSYGIYSAATSSTIDADQSVISGFTRSINAPAATIYVGSSRLGGTVTVGTAHCAASYNSSWVALGSGCV